MMSQAGAAGVRLTADRWYCPAVTGFLAAKRLKGHTKGEPEDRGAKLSVVSCRFSVFGKRREGDYRSQIGDFRGYVHAELWTWHPAPGRTAKGWRRREAPRLPAFCMKRFTWLAKASQE